jgi:hypothetical protein
MFKIFSPREIIWGRRWMFGKKIEPKTGGLKNYFLNISLFYFIFKGGISLTIEMSIIIHGRSNVLRNYFSIWH